MPEIQLAVAMFSLQQIIFQNGMASAFPLEQLLLVFWQIKNDTLTGNFGFVGNKMAFTTIKLTEIRKPFYYLQKQCKHYRFNHKTVYKTIGISTGVIGF